MSPLRSLLLLEAIAFTVASVIHSGVVIDASIDPGASTAEGVIAAVLYLGAIVAWLRPQSTRAAAGLAQGFGLAGSLIGLYLAVRGLGASTTPDLIFHVAVVVTLAVGVMATIRARPSARVSEAT